MKTGFSAIGILSVVSVVLQVSAASGPSLVPDYNRDGMIDPVDFERARDGEAFTIWLNDDDDAEGTEDGAEAGDTNTDLHDVPGGDGNDRDCDDGQVNGRCDLLDFFPVLVDVTGVEGSGDYTWKLVSTSVNVVFTQLQTGNAGNFHTKEEKALDNETPLYEAEVVQLAGDDGKEEVALPDNFLKEGRGVIIVEGAAIGEGLTLRGTKAGSDPVEVTLNLSVVNVEDMYGWMNLRGAQPSTSQPLNFSTSQPDNRHFVLVHGYNTNHEEARGNAAEFYKKLYQSGSDAMFTAVEWKGDQSWVEFFGQKVTPNYHVNVENAFAAARPFADACRKLPGEKILVAHSLGNVLVSSAIKDYGLDYTKYVMLNAAVAREAFDANVTDVGMVDEDWLNLEEAPLLERASHWYENFADHMYDPYEYRRKLAWRGRFADLPRTVNYYSQSDNFLVNPAPNEPDPDKVFYPNDPEIYRKVNELLEAKLVNGKSIGRGGIKKTGFGFWAFSEKMKGTWLLDVVNDVLTNMLEVAQTDAYKCEGGWGTNANYNAEAAEFDPANTRFTPFLDERLKEPGMLDILPAETERVRAQHLADAIPAESFAAGANPVATLENVDEESFIGENPDWPLYEGEEIGEARTNLWNHSTFREVAFYHTSKFYASLAAVGKPRIIIDTDLGSSMDDLFTIDLAARMHREGKLDLMAVMMDRPDNSDEKGQGEFLKFADRYLASLGFGDLPLGKSMPLEKKQDVFNPYWTLIYSNNVTGVGALMPTNRTDAQICALTDAVSLYRRLLANAPDKSVVICSTGFLSNLRALMDSGEDYEGDGIWSTGLNLIAAKVKELRIMGGCFDYSTAPGGAKGAEYNFAGDPVAAKKVVEEWPTPVVLSPWEVGLKLYYKSDDVLADFPAGTFDPVIRAAYTYWPDPGPDAMNRLWDPMTVLPLIEGETLVPLSEKGLVSVDGFGKTTFVPDPSSNRCYQVAANMNATAVMNRLREIYRMGNPSVTMLVSGKPEPGVDYNGSELVFKFENLQLGSFAEEDLKFSFAVDGAEYAPESSERDETLGVLSVRFVIPPDAVTAGNEYDGTLTVSLENAELGENIMYTGMCTLVQGRVAREEDPTDWFYEMELATPINYVPATAMPERCLATVEATVAFAGQTFAVEYLSPTGAVQGAVRIVADGADGYKFQYFACVGKTNENSFVRGWWDFNIGGEDVGEIRPVPDKEYVVRAEAYYFEDARGEENTLVVAVEEVGSNRGMVKQFIGSIVNEKGGQGGTTRLHSVGFAGAGEISSLVGNYYANTVNANLARVDGDREYATVAEAVAAADGNPIRLLHAASWSPSTEDAGKAIRFLNRSLLVLDESNLPGNARAVWTDVDGNSGTLTLELVFADTVVYGTIRTAEEENPVAEAIAVKDGQYVYVGDEAGAEAFIEDGVTEVVDHRGKGMVMPGCTDGHSHYTMKFSLDNMKGSVMFALEDDKTAVLQKLSAAARTAKDAGKQSLYGFGWNIVTLRVESKLTLKELDDATYGVSTVIFDQAGHSAYCNSECLKRCGIIDGRGNVLITKIDGGLLELDDQDYPTGYVNERVTGYLMRMGGIVYDEIIDDEVAEAAIRATQELLLSTGYTTVLEGWSNMLHPSKLYAAAHRMDTNGVLKLVFPMTYEVEPWQTNMTEQIDYLASLKETYGTRHVLPDYLKIFMDGVVETRTGAISKPYKDGTTYKSFWSVDRLADITRACNAKGLTVHVHTMGDAAIKETADAYIQGGDGTHRNCLVHLRNVYNEDFKRFADNNIACTAGFTWHCASVEQDEFLSQFLDDEYVYHGYPMKSFFEAGVKVSSHSDFPANEPSPQDPFGIMQVAVTGMVPDPLEGEKPYDTNELITVEQAFQALTLNGAWQLGLENERGSIKVGKYADFVLADQDVFTCATNDIGKTKVVSTWFEGEKVYEASVTVMLPAAVAGFSYVVSNLTAGAEIEVSTSMPGGSEYGLPIGAKVGIYAVPSEGFMLVGEPYVIEEVTAKTTLEGVILPWAVDCADTVVYGTIRTAEATDYVNGAIAVKDGKYVYVGDEAGVAPYIQNGVTEIIDHRGKGMVMPGCTDGHSHYITEFAQENMVGGVRFSVHDDKTNVLQKLETAALAAQAAGKRSLYGFGWYFLTLMIDTPTLKELDDATHGVSTVILDHGGHHAFCNTECLKRCGILGDDGKVLITEIDGGYLELDANGYPTGYADERVTGYLMRMGGIDYDDLIGGEEAEIAVRKTQELLLSTGYTTALDGWSNMLHPSRFYEAAHNMDTNGELKIVFPLTYEVEPWQTNMTSEIDRLAALKEAYGTSHVRLEYLKIFMDGVVETRTGALVKPYKPIFDGEEPMTYKSFWTTNRLADITRESNAKGLTVHVHAMGDAAVRDTVDAYIYGGDGTHRNCIVHLRDVATNDFQRIAANNIACSAGMTWHVPLGDEAEPLRLVLEPEYLEHAYPIKSFFDAGVKVSSHSDFPANGDCPQDPFGIIEAAVTGLNPNLPDDAEPYDTSELITVEQAFQALTLNGAWQLGLENERGSIEVGKWADFVLADRDVFTCATNDIGKTKVVSTWFEGEKVYELPPADTVVYGTIRTAEAADYVDGAIAVRGGRFVYVGDESGVAAFVKDGVTEIIDHRGKGMVMPGCTDAHSHYTLKFGLDNMKGGVMFSDDDDKTNVLRKLEAAAKLAKDAGKDSLFGFGWDFATLVMGGSPTLEELDAVTYGVSTIIFDTTVHNVYCNSACLRRCGIIDDKGTVLVDKIDGGLLELDENGRPTGYANERVTGYLMRMGGINYDEIIDDEVAESTLLAAQKLLLSTGYTTTLEGWSNLLHPRKFYEAACRMDTNGALKILFPMTYEVEPWQTNMVEQIDHLVSLKETYGTQHVRPEYLKIFMDGCVETLTGAISKPYKHNDAVYNSFWPVERLADITRKANAKDLTVHIHAMGDVAIQEATDAYIQGGDRVHRNCLVHLRNVRQDDFRRFADNNIACTAGMTWHVTMGEEGELMRQFIADEFVDHSYPMKSFFDAGVKVSSHSDFPANEGCPQDPFGIIQVAVTGMVPDPLEGEKPYDTNELITVEQAFQALTLNGAWQLGLENERGSIKVGKYADFVLADQDVFTCATNDIGKTKVVSTWFEGEKVYEASESVPVTPGVPVVFDTADAATNGVKLAVLTPSESVAAVLTESAKRRRYADSFGFVVRPADGGKYAVEAALTDEARSNLVGNASELTRRIALTNVVALAGDATTNLILVGGVSGFYYSLYDGTEVTNLAPDANPANLNVLCGADATVVFPEVKKPSEERGFFTVGVEAAPAVRP